MLVAATAAGIVAWFGAAVIVLSDGRRGFAMGLAIAGLGMAIAAALQGDAVSGTAIAAGGVVAAVLRLRDGPPGWSLLLPGSTPRLVLSTACLAAAILGAASLTSPPDLPVRIGGLAVLAVAGARLVGGAGRPQSLALSSALALALGALAGGPASAAGALAAVAVGMLGGAEVRRE